VKCISTRLDISPIDRRLSPNIFLSRPSRLVVEGKVIFGHSQTLSLLMSTAAPSASGGSGDGEKEVTATAAVATAMPVEEVSAASSSDEPRIVVLLRQASTKGDREEVIRLLSLCDAIYYSTKPHVYRGKRYVMQDLPSDVVYTSYRKQFTPEVDPTRLYVKGAINVRGDELIKHDYPMGSLAKFDSSSIAKLQTIFLRLGGETDAIAVSMKVDGVSMQIQFEKGHLIKAVTRFDHEFGRSVRAIAAKFVHRPDPSFDGKLVVDGEVILRGSVFEKLGFKNARNGAAGILNRKSLSDAHFLDYIAWNLTAYEPTKEAIERGWPAERPKLVSEQFALLAQLGYSVAPIQLLGRDILAEAKLNSLLDSVKKANADIPCDGLVICPNTWVTETTDPPKMKVAYKGPNSGDMTTVVRIEPRAERTGIVIPQVYVEPVHVGGIVVTSIAGANYSILMERRIRIGSQVLVVKAKEVIPYIETVDNEGVETTEPPVPTVCPACSTALLKKERMLMCPNMTCPAKMVGRVEHFLDLIGVKGIGKKRLEALKVESLHELYALTVDAIMQLDGFGKKTAQTLFDQIRSCINPIEEGVLLAAIGPPLIGAKTAALVVGHVHLEELFGSTPIAMERLLSVKGIGLEKATQLVNFHREGSNLLLLLRSQGLLITRAPDAAAATSSSAAAPSATGSIEVICLTGTGSRSRVDYEVAIAAKGWRAVASVSQKTTIVVTNDISAATTKMAKARELGKRIITYDELDSLLA